MTATRDRLRGMARNNFECISTQCISLLKKKKNTTKSFLRHKILTQVFKYYSWLHLSFLGTEPHSLSAFPFNPHNNPKREELSLFYQWDNWALRKYITSQWLAELQGEPTQLQSQNVILSNSKIYAIMNKKI